MHPRVYKLLMKLVSDYIAFIKQKKGGTFPIIFQNSFIVANFSTICMTPAVKAHIRFVFGGLSYPADALGCF